MGGDIRSFAIAQDGSKKEKFIYGELYLLEP